MRLFLVRFRHAHGHPWEHNADRHPQLCLLSDSPLQILHFLPNVLARFAYRSLPSSEYSSLKGTPAMPPPNSSSRWIPWTPVDPENRSAKVWVTRKNSRG